MMCGLIPATILSIPIAISWIAYPFFSGTFDIAKWCGYTIIVGVASWGIAALTMLVLVVNRVHRPPARTGLPRPIFKLILVVLAWITLPLLASFWTIDYAVSIIANI